MEEMVKSINHVVLGLILIFLLIRQLYYFLFLEEE